MMSSFALVALCCVYFFVSTSGVFSYEVQSLTSYLWDVKNSNNSFQLKATVPGGIYNDLLKAGIWNQSIYYRLNDVNYRWVAHENWTYSVKFAVAPTNSQKSYILVFHGLDGHASIFLNRHRLGKAINTFVRYSFDVSNLIKLNQNENILEIQFESPIVSGKRLADESSHTIPPKCVPPNYNGECYVNFLRRMPASYGWDWGLAAPSVGIWKPVELVAYRDDLIIRDVTALVTSPSKEEWEVAVHVFCEGLLHTDTVIGGKIEIILSVENGESIEILDIVSLNSSTAVEEKKPVSTNVLHVPKDKVNLWWPNGYGSQSLYKLEVTFRNEHGSNKKTIFVGFRDIRLVQDFVNISNPSLGRSFYFSVNGAPIFAKGTNYIPHNIFLEEAGNKETITNLLLAVKEANMNMIRIWGGGIYADDFFYEECDRLGIMVWQDMMFACSMYPADKAFLSNVQEEISQQIRRLQHHTSIAIWAGNNENEAALRGNWYGTANNFELYKKDYTKLYVDTAKKTVLKYDNTRAFLVSSPTNGEQSEKEGYIAENPYDSRYGDIHHYNYVKNSWLSDDYPMTRFSSEYGFQSLPSLSSLQEVASEEDLKTLDSKFFKYRQHQPLGYIYLVSQLVFHFPTPKLTDIPNLIYLSQINQAWSVKLQTEWYRSWRTKITSRGEGQTMGAMYWQLNDVWQAPSWSSIEFNGKWKMLHYHAKKFFAPAIVTAHIWKNGDISVSLISDLLYDLSNVELRTTIFSWSSWTPVSSTQDLVTLKKESASEYLKTNIDKLLESHTRCHSNEHQINTKCFVKFNLTDTKSGKLIHENFLFPSSFNLAEGIQSTNIQIKVQSCNVAKVCNLKVRTSAISAFVWLDTKESGHFSDNGFMMTEPEKTVEFYSRLPISVDELQISLSATVLDKERLCTLTNGATSSVVFNSLFKYSKYTVPI